MKLINNHQCNNTAIIFHIELLMAHFPILVILQGVKLIYVCICFLIIAPNELI